MLPVQKTKQLQKKLQLALKRLQDIRQVKDVFYSYLQKTNSLEKVYAKKIWDSMTGFEDKIVKMTFYSSDKVKLILNFTKIYREFSLHWERVSKVNLKNLELISNDLIATEQKMVNDRAKIFYASLKTYIVEEQTYNCAYTDYEKNCKNLNEDISKFKSYSDPIFFYNQKLTSEFLQKLKKKHNRCNIEESKIKTKAQMLDQKRLELSESLGEVRQVYVRAFRENMKVLYSGISYVIDPSKDQVMHKENYAISKDQMQEEKLYLSEVDNLMGNSVKNNEDPEIDAVFEDFKELFKKEPSNEITTEQRFFFDRCENLKNKKLKRSNEIIDIQKKLMHQIEFQMSSFQDFESSYHKNEKALFKKDGIDSYSKRFRKYFGQNFHQLFELCVLLAERPRKSLQKILKSMESCQLKMSNTFKEKKQQLTFFENRSDVILENHRKSKEAFDSLGFTSKESVQEYKKSVLNSYEQFCKNYKELDRSEDEMDRIFFKNLKQLSDIILKEALNKSLTKIIEKEKNRVEIFNKIKIDTEMLKCLREGIKYELFFSGIIKPNLKDSFRTIVNNQDFQETKVVLQQKQHTLRGMVKHKVTCCGVKSEPETSNVKESHDCILVDFKEKKEYEGVLNILSNGINYSQKSMNPFANLLQLIVPNTDIDTYKTDVIEAKQFLSIQTKKGPFHFRAPDISTIYKRLVDILGMKILQKDSSERVNKERSSSMTSFLGTGGSQEFRLRYEKSTSESNPCLSQGDRSPFKSNLRNSAKFTTSGQTLRKLGRKLLEQEYFSENFLPEKAQSERNHSRCNFHYQNSHHRFLLKQKKQVFTEGDTLTVEFNWKVSFPNHALLHSFKHHETVRIQIENTEVSIRIVHAVNLKNVSLAQKIFYDEIVSMNDAMNAFIVSQTQREGKIIIEPENAEEFPSEERIAMDDIVVNCQKRDSKYEMSQTGDHFFKGDKVERSLSIRTNRY